MTPTQELGTLTGPLLIFGGPYSNLQATRALLDAAQQLDFSPEQLICTGDAVAYCADAEATVQLLRDAGVHWIQGNCEESLGNRIDDCGCGFDDGSSCAVLSDSWYRYADAAISDASRAWLKSLPAQLGFSLNGRRIRVVHGAVDQINRFVFESTPVAQKQHQLELARADVLIGGHCGLPFGQAMQNGSWLNAGVIGMPANDGTADGWYMLLAPEGEDLKASWHRLEYDAAGAALAMQQARLPAAYRESLLSGFWPNLDILPARERGNQGRRLQPPTLRL
ncbi:metallophosphoesterase family protein [Marinobacterium rhizophilum]|nr:metallophosphoesterase family protein [Marinobacterium rhizophilum]